MSVASSPLDLPGEPTAGTVRFRWRRSAGIWASARSYAFLGLKWVLPTLCILLLINRIDINLKVGDNERPEQEETRTLRRLLQEANERSAARPSGAPLDVAVADTQSISRSRPRQIKNLTHYVSADDTDTLIILVTPTYSRPERLPDMTRFSQTLMHVDNLFWIVIEDAHKTVPAVEDILKRSGHPYIYLPHKTPPGVPPRGWAQRNVALQWIREHFAKATRNSVVYFADDDNTYDIRIFDRYIRKVKRLGIWAVALAGAAYVEAPQVENEKVIGWNVVYAPKRAFAVDMAGFATNTKEIIRTNVLFEKVCKQKAPETCFLWRMGFRMNDVEPFGHNDNPKEILVWHTKTRKLAVRGGIHGYVVETMPPANTTTAKPPPPKEPEKKPDEAKKEEPKKAEEQKKPAEPAKQAQPPPAKQPEAEKKVDPPAKDAAKPAQAAKAR